MSDIDAEFDTWLIHTSGTKSIANWPLAKMAWAHQAQHIAELEKEVERPRGRVLTDNTAVIRTLEARIAELVAQKTRSQEHYIKLLGKAEAENQRLRVALDRYRGQIDRFGTESAGEALQEQEK